MKCKECNKDFNENELMNGVCFDCFEKLQQNNQNSNEKAEIPKTEKNKNSNLKIIILSVTLSVLISLLFINLINNNIGLSDFKIDSFNMDTETNSYGSSYSGTGTISCTDTSTNYFVLIQESNKTTGKISFNYAVVHDGKGEFGTYDSSYSGVTQKPEYDFKIIGYRSFKDNK